MRARWTAVLAASIALMPINGVASDVEMLPHVVSIAHVPPGTVSPVTIPSSAWQDQPLYGRAYGTVWQDGAAPSGSLRRATDRVLGNRICELNKRVDHGSVAPGTGGGRFQINYALGSTLNTSGSMAFAAKVSGSPRNQGVFVSDSTGVVRAIVIGCGNGGGGGNPGSGCGDGSPIGGTFSGLFPGTIFTPAINDPGDVLFLSDVHGGASSRGLFLYQAATDKIVKVAAVGDPSPLGGVFAAIGPGSLNDNGTVVFIAAPPSTDVTRADVFRWQAGVVTKIAAVGDTAPGGGTISRIGEEAFGFIDGTSIPIGPVPDINDSNQICFNAWMNIGAGVIVRTGAVSQWYVRPYDPTPAGGMYASMRAAAINNHGEVAFYADYYLPSGDPSGGWFEGRPGHWRKVIVFDDPIDGGVCHGLAVSRNPMQTIDEEGNVAFWTGLGSIDDQRGRVVVASRDGARLVVARDGESAPSGGVYTQINAWPSLCNRRGTFNASTSGTPVSGSLMTYRLCTTVAVTLQSFGSRWAGNGVEVFWQLAGIESELAFEVYRKELPGAGSERIEALVNRVSGHDFGFVDRSAEVGRTYRYSVIMLEGGEPVTSFDTEIATPRAGFVLHPNVPNPFNPMTRIDFALDGKTRAALAVYDVLGRPVRTLLLASLPPGPHSVTWDGRDDRGSAVASGIYVLQLTADGRTLRRKAVLLK